MNEATRRGFLVASGAGAAAAGVAVIAPSAEASSRPARDAATRLPANAHGSIVAYIDDVRADTVFVLVGEREVVVRDAELVARLARAAQEG